MLSSYSLIMKHNIELRCGTARAELANVETYDLSVATNYAAAFAVELNQDFATVELVDNKLAVMDAWKAYPVNVSNDCSPRYRICADAKYTVK